MIEIIKPYLKNEELIGIIPLNPKRLKINFAGKTLSPSAGELAVIGLICLIPSLFISAFVGFIIGLIGYPFILFFILIYGGIILGAESIYVNTIKKYPDPLLVLCNSSMHFMLIQNNAIEIYNKFGSNFDNLHNIFYGQIDKRTGRIGENFEIRINNNTELSGKINIIGNRLFGKDLQPQNILALDLLRKIYTTA